MNMGTVISEMGVKRNEFVIQWALFLDSYDYFLALLMYPPILPFLCCFLFLSRCVRVSIVRDIPLV